MTRESIHPLPPLSCIESCAGASVDWVFPGRGPGLRLVGGVPGRLVMGGEGTGRGAAMVSVVEEEEEERK